MDDDLIAAIAHALHLETLWATRPEELRAAAAAAQVQRELLADAAVEPR